LRSSHVARKAGYFDAYLQPRTLKPYAVVETKKENRKNKRRDDVPHKRIKNVVILPEETLTISHKGLKRKSAKRGKLRGRAKPRK